MRVEPERLRFEIAARDGAARAGTIHTAHGPIETPAFIPLATKGTVRGLESREVAGLGYQLILGNTYHLFVSPGPERIAAAGGLHGFMGWERALITDSGGFQVFSLAHGGVANEVKGSGRSGGEHGSKVEITEEGARFQSYRDGSELFISPEVSMRVQAALGSDIALVFDECTPFHADREYTARSTERTHRWLDRCLAWHEREGPERQAVFGIVQGGVHEDLRRESAQRVSAAGVDGIAIGGTLGRDKEEMHAVLAMTAPLLPEEAPKHLLGIGEVDDLLGGIALGLDIFDCAVPTRLARHGVALAPDPEKRWRLDMRKGGWAGNREPLVEGCPCPACRQHDRDYVSYLSRAEELTAVRLLVTHNLTYMHQLTTHARTAIAAGRFDAYRAAVLAGASPWDAASSAS
ncbi:MAG TPA: tRNA guanosine(34) transglycosylase Tgt [Solirubrobacterales bacterium]|jgi:queuine tRNA-ribosyltransferase|nr:tRNA guanosine(34) transglycosylase Tgt [Solirubrobacterales bacterium]